MAKKADFSGINTQRRMNVADELQTEISMQGQQATASKEEAAARAATGRTQGRKGAKAVRINMAFSPDNHEFIKVMASQTGRTMTETCNLIVQAFREAHPEMLERARAAVEEMKAGGFAELPAKK